MKGFVSTFLVVLILLFVFAFFGGFMLFDFSSHFWFAIASCAFVASLVIHAFSRQSEKIEELENRIKSLEENKKGAE